MGIGKSALLPSGQREVDEAGTVLVGHVRLVRGLHGDVVVVDRAERTGPEKDSTARIIPGGREGGGGFTLVDLLVFPAV